MTKAKWSSKTRGMNLDETLVRLARRLQSAQDSGEKRTALRDAFGHVLQLVQLTNWRAGAVYRLGNAFVSADDEAKRAEAISNFLDIIDAAIPEVSETANRLELTSGLTRHLHIAGFTAKEIAELIDDGRGGTAEQQQERAKSRFSGEVSEVLQKFWENALGKGKDGTRHSL